MNSELKRAYREHANTRLGSSLSMPVLYCAGAIQPIMPPILDAMWHEQSPSLKDLGLDIKLMHQDARLNLMSHASESLHKRGFKFASLAGMASVIQMLVAQEHRLVIPFSLKTLQCTLAPLTALASLCHTEQGRTHWNGVRNPVCKL
jgi:hypothetical protein